MTERSLWVATADTKNQYPVKEIGDTEYALFGRSNVGKSSLLNALLGAKLARVSQQPGKTRLIHFYRRGTLLFVDVPGFGYAVASAKEKGVLGRRLEEYFYQKRAAGVLYLFDVRRDPKEEDLEQVAILESLSPSLCIVCTKLDKIPVTKRYRRKKELQNMFGSDKQLHFVSIHEEETVEELLKSLKKKRENCSGF